MRPLKLKMTAFGPYRETEIIDFNELKDNKLFVISGNTGSGKTTIFDGICFALYGSASGEDRDNYAMLRSDFADDAVHTAVELEFSLQDRRFRVLRQLGHIKKGNKSRTGERYEFFELQDTGEVPAVDRQMVSEIDSKIESLIGLSQDQFKQIVMLPQGEFRKLLTSSTENKEAILRRLFKTEPYKNIAEQLRKRKNHIEKRYLQEKQTLNHYLQEVKGALAQREDSTLFNILSSEFYNMNQVMSGLDEEIAYYEVQTERDDKAYHKATKVYDHKQDHYHKATALNNRFLELETKKIQLEELTHLNDTFELKGRQIKDAEQANQIIPYEQQFEEVEKDVASKTNLLIQAKEASILAEDNFKKMSLIYDAEESKQGERENLSREIDRLKDFLPIVKDIDDKETYLASLKKAGQKSVAELDKIKNSLAVTKSENEAGAKLINQNETAILGRSDKKEKLAFMREQVKVLLDYIKYFQLDSGLNTKIQKEEKHFNEVKQAYQHAEKQWLNSQASILAIHLHDGEACPVCGSEAHPNKAMSTDELITKEYLESLKTKRDKQDDIYRHLLAQHRANTEQLKEVEANVIAYHIALDEVDFIKEQLIEDGKKLGKEVETLERLSQEMIKQKERHTKQQEEIKALEQSKEKIEQTYLEQKSLYETRHAVFKDRINKVPEEVRNLTVLEKRINDSEKNRENLERVWVDAQKKRQMASENQTLAKSNLSHAKKQQDEMYVKRDEAKKRFELAVADASFTTIESYRLAKMSLQALERLRKECADFRQNKATLLQQVNELQLTLKDSNKVDLNMLQTELIDLKAAYETAFKLLNQTKHYKEEANRLKELIETAYNVTLAREKELSVITDLYDVIRGQNSKKISFERYLQITYLEQIIEAANNRLETLSNGQFLLMRSDRQESRGRQSGLALDVYDGYTGQTRDVKTLSGGEKFNASLCLALGMSDVIQSFQGNVSIKTMFIDEGFGTLDEESLHKSIDILIDLQRSGRMIGIISHVQELKDIFPAILEVKKTQEGYSETKFIIK